MLLVWCILKGVVDSFKGLRDDYVGLISCGCFRGVGAVDVQVNTLTM